MKKKLACFLAAIMTITALPVNAFALSSTGRVASVRTTRPVIHAQNGTRFIEATSQRASMQAANMGNNGNHWAVANELAIVFDEDVNITQPLQFTLELENAEWFFRNGGPAGGSGITIPAGNVATFDVARGAWNPTTLTYTRFADPFALLTLNDDGLLEFPNGETFTDNEVTAAELVGILDWLGANNHITIVNRPGLNAAATANAIAAEMIAAAGNDLRDIAEYFTNNPLPMEITLVGGPQLYTLQVSRANPSIATVTVNSTLELRPIFSTPGRPDTLFNIEAPTAEVPKVDRPVARPGVSIDTGDIAVNDAIETFGKKDKEVQAPEGEPKPASTEAVLVDAMDELDYAKYSRATRDGDEVTLETVRDEIEEIRDDARVLRNASPLLADAVKVFLNEFGADFIVPDSTPAQTFSTINDIVVDQAIVQTSLNNLVADINNASDFTVTIGSNAAGSATGTRAQRLQNHVFMANLRLQQLETLILGMGALAPGDVISAPNLALVQALLQEIDDHLTDALVILVPTAGGAGGGNFNVLRNVGIRIPLVTIATGSNNEQSVRVTASNPIPIDNRRVVFASTASGTTSSVREVVTSRTRFALNPLIVQENRPGIFPASPSTTDEVAAFDIVAPSGFFFDISNLTISAEGGMNNLVGARSEYVAVQQKGNQNDRRAVRIFYESVNPSIGLPGSITVQGLVLVAINQDNVREDREISITVRPVPAGVEDRVGAVTTQEITVARSRDFAVTLTSPTNTVPQLISGRLNGDMGENAARRVRLSEVVPSSLWNGRDINLTLPREVRVLEAAFNGFTNLHADTVAALGGTFYNVRSIANQSPEVRINDNVISLRNLHRANTNNTMAFNLDLWLSIEPGFEGEITLEVTGGALNELEKPSIVIAEAIAPIRIEAEVQPIRMGYTFVPTANFKVVENIDCGLISGEELYISVTDEFMSEIHIANNFIATVTEGDLEIGGQRTSNNLGIFNNWNNNLNWRLGTNIIVDIVRESSKPSTITFENIALRLSPTSPMPQGSHTYNLVAWGPAVAENFVGLLNRDQDNTIPENTLSYANNFFNTPGVAQAFVRAQGAGVSGTLSNVVRVTTGSSVVLVNEAQMGMDTAPYISEASDSLMVPVRFIAMALGLEAGRVLWDADRATVTVDAGERIVQFTMNSSTMRVNGVEIPMLNALGNKVYAEVRDERAFIPFRALADALNVFVSWDPATTTATFDATRPAERNFHLEDILGQAAPTAQAPVAATVAKMAS